MVQRLLRLVGVLQAAGKALVGRLLWQLLEMLGSNAGGLQSVWDEVASRWLDLIRPVWYERLRAGGRNKSVLLKDIRAAVIITSEAELLPKILDGFEEDEPN